MGVYIKGAKMPRHCTECLFCKRSCDEARNYVDFICIVDGTISSCPLIPIPDHGDLIDRDVVADALDVMAVYGRLQDAFDMVMSCEAVIPAERSEE